MTEADTREIRSPNYCPFCGTHCRHGGTGQRFGTFVCGKCHADYDVTYYRAYPPSEQAACDAAFTKHGGTLTDR